MEKCCSLFSIFCEVVHEFTVTSECPEVFFFVGISPLDIKNFNVESKLVELGIDCKITLN
jgi:hypothetical protein